MKKGSLSLPTYGKISLRKVPTEVRRSMTHKVCEPILVATPTNIGSSRHPHGEALQQPKSKGEVPRLKPCNQCLTTLHSSMT